MKIEIATANYIPSIEPQVGSVYNVRGGRGAREGHMQVIFHITDARCGHSSMALLFVIDREGNFLSTTSYGVHYFEDKQPIAYVEGLEDLTFVMRSL